MEFVRLGAMASFSCVSFQGITVDVCPETGRLRIARILAGGLIEKQGMLHVGDKIVEVNNVRTSTAENLQTLLRKAKPGTIVFKVNIALSYRVEVHIPRNPPICESPRNGKV